MSRRKVLVVGASSGFGAAIAEILVAQGDCVIGTSRSAPADGPVSDRGPTMARLDVCDSESVTALATRLEHAGAMPDVLIYNAGFGISGAIEDTRIETAKSQFETNFFGAHSVVRAFLPSMREKRNGRIILIGSIGGRIPIPFQAFYSASKAAADVYVKALRMETKAFGIHVTLIEPGDHHTGFSSARPTSESSESSAYQPQAARALKIMEESEKSGAPASDVAELVARVASLKKPKSSYVQGSSIEKLSLTLQKYLPSGSFESFLMSAYKVPSNLKRDSNT